MTTNCIVTPKESYKDRVYVTGVVGFDGLKRIGERVDGKPKDFFADYCPCQSNVNPQLK